MGSEQRVWSPHSPEAAGILISGMCGWVREGAAGSGNTLSAPNSYGLMYRGHMCSLGKPEHPGKPAGDESWAVACVVLVAVVLLVETVLVLFLLLMGALVALVFQGHDLPWEPPWTEILNSPERNLYTVPTLLDLTSGAFGWFLLEQDHGLVVSA